MRMAPLWASGGPPDSTRLILSYKRATHHRISLTREVYRQPASIVQSRDRPRTINPHSPEPIWEVGSDWRGHRDKLPFQALPEIQAIQVWPQCRVVRLNL